MTTMTLPTAENTARATSLTHTLDEVVHDGGALTLDNLRHTDVRSALIRAVGEAQDVLATLAAGLTKRCPGCQQDRPTKSFYGDRTRPDGLMARCRSCILKARKARPSRRKPVA